MGELSWYCTEQNQLDLLDLGTKIMEYFKILLSIISAYRRSMSIYLPGRVIICHYLQMLILLRNKTLSSQHTNCPEIIQVLIAFYRFLRLFYSTTS